MKTYKYHTSHSFKTSDGTEVSFVSQLYKVGIYGIVNGDASMQVTLEPANIVTMEKKLKAREKKGEITDLKFGREITVSDATGFWEEQD